MDGAEQYRQNPKIESSDTRGIQHIKQEKSWKL